MSLQVMYRHSPTTNTRLYTTGGFAVFGKRWTKTRLIPYGHSARPLMPSALAGQKSTTIFRR